MDDSKNIMKYLGFLVEDYQMRFSFQTFDEYNGFAGPSTLIVSIMNMDVSQYIILFNVMSGVGIFQGI